MRKISRLPLANITIVLAYDFLQSTVNTKLFHGIFFPYTFDINFVVSRPETLITLFSQPED